MNDLKPMPCPNPECRANCFAIFYIPPHSDDDPDGKHPINGYVCHVDCPQCEYAGPLIRVKDDDIESAKVEAIRLHNLICRPLSEQAPSAVNVEARDAVTYELVGRISPVHIRGADVIDWVHKESLEGGTELYRKVRNDSDL